MIWMKAKFNFSSLSYFHSPIEGLVFKLAKINSLPINLNLCHPGSQISVPSDSGHPASVIFSFRGVLLLLGKIDISKIFHAVIQSISVDVIDGKAGQLSLDHQPDESMHQKSFSLNADPHVRSTVHINHVAGWHAHLNPIPGWFFPSQGSSLWAVIKSFIQELRSKPGLGSCGHCHERIYCHGQ